MLNITEIFRSIQGESTHAGLPCIFVRLSGCNLHCRWCDTEYARAPGIAMTITAILDEITSLGSGMVEITGGEPLLQPATPELISRVAETGRRVMLETNGSVVLPAARSCIVIMDIKTPSSGESEHFCVDNIERLRPGDEVKFVISDRADFEWATERIKGYGLCGRGVNLLMSPVSGSCNPAHLADWILTSALPDLRLQLQLHRLLWPERDRGV